MVLMMAKELHVTGSLNDFTLCITNIALHFYPVPSLINSSNLTIKSIITLLHRRYSKL
jgi:hypothetical protein